MLRFSQYRPRGAVRLRSRRWFDLDLDFDLDFDQIKEIRDVGSASTVVLRGCGTNLLDLVKPPPT
jgi:hypothetical protein